jgi:hypothetical protein
MSYDSYSSGEIGSGELVFDIGFTIVSTVPGRGIIASTIYVTAKFALKSLPPLVV